MHWWRTGHRLAAGVGVVVSTELKLIFYVKFAVCSALCRNTVSVILVGWLCVYILDHKMPVFTVLREIDELWCFLPGAFH